MKLELDERMLKDIDAKAYKVARKIPRSFMDPEDIRQEILVFVLENFKWYRPEKSSPRTFLNLCANCAAYDIIQKAYLWEKKKEYKPRDLCYIMEDFLCLSPEEEQYLSFFLTLNIPRSRIRVYARSIMCLSREEEEKIRMSISQKLKEKCGV